MNRFSELRAVREYLWAFQLAQTVKNLPAMWETRFDPWVGKILWRRNGNPLQYYRLENLMDRGAW